MSSRFSHYWLILVLLISQFALVWHQFDVDKHTDTAECPICLAAQGIDPGCAPNCHSPSHSTVSVAAETPPTQNPVSRTPQFKLARSPPPNTLLL